MDTSTAHINLLNNFEMFQLSHHLYTTGSLQTKFHSLEHNYGTTTQQMLCFKSWSDISP